MFRSSSSPSSYHNPIRLRRAFGEERQAKRVYERFSCDLRVAVWSYDARTRVGVGRLRNLSMGGAFLECVMGLEKGALYHFQIARGNIPIVVAGHVARVIRVGSIRSNQYGISFTLGAKQQNLLKAIIDPMRARAAKPAVDDEKVKWYWGM
ncbi:MAG: PilZ domain-containing protein [Elusimicrobia bacterium]|nr:PilZ domain-containing protein [Elusimicrobiota bacterium]